MGCFRFLVIFDHQMCHDWRVPRLFFHPHLLAAIFRRHQICTSSTNRLIVGCKRNESIAAIVEFKPFRFRFPRKGAESCEGTSFFSPTHTGIYEDFYKTLELESPSLLHVEFHEGFDSQKCQLIRRTQMCSPFFSQFYASKESKPLKYSRFRNNKIGQAHTGGEDSLFICPNGSAAGQGGFWRVKRWVGTCLLEQLEEPKRCVGWLRRVKTYCWWFRNPAWKPVGGW